MNSDTSAPLPRATLPPPASQDPSTIILTVIFVLGTLGSFVFISPEKFLHWFVIPVSLCGIIIGVDAMDWLRRRIDIFDPVGIIGLIGAHFFFLAPLLHVHWDLWLRHITAPDDWRLWLGWMAIINVFGLVMYRIARNWMCPPKALNQPTRHYWKLDPDRFKYLLIIAIIVTGLLQVFVYARMGGIMGYIRAYTLREDGFKGMGLLFMVTESFPILCLFGFVLFSRIYKKKWSWGTLFILLGIFLVLRILFGGLRGSRSNTVWALFWAVGVIHYWLRGLNRRVFVIGLMGLVIFMYVYGFYKGAGLEVFDALQGTTSLAELENRTGRDLRGTLLQDLGRADIQAYLLHRLQLPNSDYQYSWGRTYLGAFIMLWPWQLWPDWFPQRPAGKVVEGTELQYGLGSYEAGGFSSSRAYGLSGETMFNFGPIGIPFAFFIFGLMLGWVRRLYFQLSADDSRLLLLPFLINLCFAFLVGDSDNVIFFIFKNGSVPIALVLLGSLRIRTRPQPLPDSSAHSHHVRPNRWSNARGY